MRVLATLTAWLLAHLTLAADPTADGRRIYQQGRLPSGEPITGIIGGTVPVQGSQFACAKCHRPSGFGSTEGSILTPPITAPALFNERDPDRGEQFHSLFQQPRTLAARAAVRVGQPRAAYTLESFTRTLRTGKDPNGEMLNPVMPRFELSDADVQSLFTYLQTLSATNSPGVDQQTIHLGFVLDERLTELEKSSLRSVAQAYVQRKNTDTKAKQARVNFSPHYKDHLARAFRQWQIHEWRLEGQPSEWPAQLAALYGKQPVFALVGGSVVGPWDPIHQFCESNQLPCLFPITDSPLLGSNNHYTIYFSRGKTLEAAALGHYWRQVFANTPERKRSIAQWHALDSRYKAMAKAFSQHLKSTESPRLTTHDISHQPPTEAPSVVVLWIPPDESFSLESWFDVLPKDGLICLPSEWVPRAEKLDPSLRDRLRFTHPRALPGSEPARIYRTRSWLRSRRLPPGDETRQLNTFFAWNILDHALTRMVENFSRDYLIESVEHMAENSLSPGTYPHLSLGPEQRFASKGCYIVKLEGSGIVPVSDWILPSKN